jgi:SOS-response transcriptional repressor LexA
MSVGNDGISSSDIVFGQEISEKEIFDNYIYIVLLQNKVLLRKVERNNDEYILYALNNNFQPVRLKREDVVAFYKLTAIIKKTINHFR